VAIDLRLPDACEEDEIPHLVHRLEHVSHNLPEAEDAVHAVR
jgi:hypothetical protein